MRLLLNNSIICDTKFQSTGTRKITVSRDLIAGWQVMIGQRGVLQLIIIVSLVMVALCQYLQCIRFYDRIFQMSLFHANLVKRFSVGMVVGGLILGLFSKVTWANPSCAYCDIYGRNVYVFWCIAWQ